MDYVINFAVDSIKNHYNISTQNIYDSEYISMAVAILVLSMFSYRL